MRCIFTNRTIGMTSFSIGTNRTIGTNGPSYPFVYIGHVCYFSVSTMGSKLPSSHTDEVLVLIAKTVMSASKFSIQNWERKRAPQRAVKGQGKREVATVSTGFSFLVQLGEAKYHLAETITFLP